MVPAPPARLRLGRTVGVLLAALLLAEAPHPAPAAARGSPPGSAARASASAALAGAALAAGHPEDEPDSAPGDPEDRSNSSGGNASARYYADVCEKFDSYYRRKFPEAERSPCAVLYDYPHFKDAFKDYMAKYKPLAYNSSAERKKRFAIFAANLVFMLESGAKDQAFTMAVNEFTDMTPEEFRRTHTGLNQTMPTLGAAKPPTGQAVPASLDWVALGGVTTPINQGSCNSCWTFATTGALEGAWFALTGYLVRLSEQQFLDCTGQGLGCQNGGNLETPYNNVATEHAICTGKSYPYTEKEGACHQSACKTAIPYGAIRGYEAVKSNDEQAMKEALVNVGPVAVGIDANGEEVQFYHCGVLTAPCSANLNHAVLVVGYGVQDPCGSAKSCPCGSVKSPVPYWNVKNSWGTSWGEAGFFRLVRGLSGSGECGVKAIPTVPSVSADGVKIPIVERAAPAELDYKIGRKSNGGAPLLSLTAIGLIATAGVLVAIGAYLACRCCCCNGGGKTRGTEVNPLYSPVCMRDEASSDDDLNMM